MQTVAHYARSPGAGRSPETSLLRDTRLYRSFTVSIVIYIPDVPEDPHQRERGRLRARGKRTDDGSMTTLLLVNENNGAWTFHGLGAPGVTLSAADTIALGESILARARGAPLRPPAGCRLSPYPRAALPAAGRPPNR